MTSEQRPVKVSREELESIIFKSRSRSWAGIGVPLLYAAAALCILLLIVMALPQSTVDGWAQRLQFGSRSVSQSSLLNPEPLELLKLDDEWSDQLFSVSGIVRNRSNETIRGGEAVLKLHGKKGPITTLVVDLDAPDLGPNQRGGFRASYKLAAEADPLVTYDLSFKLKDGTPLLHQDLRGAIPN